MTGVPGTTGYVPPPPPSPFDAGATPGFPPGVAPPPSGAAGGVDAAKLLAELAKLAATMQAQNPQGTPGVSTGSGAPSIGGVQIDFSPEDMAAALLVLQGKTQDAQLQNAKSGLDINKKKMEEKNTQALAKINDWIKKCEEAAAKEKSSSALGWFGKIAGFVAAIIAVAVAAVATVATAGAAAPLLALAVVGAVGASLSLASAISQEYGGPPLELSHWMAKGATAVLLACGVPEDKAEAAGKLMSGMAAMIACPVLVMVDPAIAGKAVGGFAELVGADKGQAAIVEGVFTAVATLAISIGMMVATGGASAADTMSKIVNIGGKISQAAIGMAMGGAAIAGGVLTMQKAELERDGANSLADKKLIDAILAKLQKQMEEDRDQIKKVMQEMMEGIQLVSQMIASASSSRSQLTAGLAGKGQTI